MDFARLSVFNEHDLAGWTLGVEDPVDRNSLLLCLFENPPSDRQICLWHVRDLRHEGVEVAAAIHGLDGAGRGEVA